MENKEEMFLDMILPNFKEGTVTQENITKTFFDLEESKKTSCLLEDGPKTWETSISNDEEENYTLSKKVK